MSNAFVEGERNSWGERNGSKQKGKRKKQGKKIREVRYFNVCSPLFLINDHLRVFFLLVMIGQLNHLLQFLLCVRPSVRSLVIIRLSFSSLFSQFFRGFFVCLVCSFYCGILITAFWLLELLRNLLYLKPQPWSQGLERNHSIHILPLPTPVNNTRSSVHPTQVCILPFSHWKREWRCWHFFCRYYGYDFRFLHIFQLNLSTVVEPLLLKVLANCRVSVSVGKYVSQGTCFTIMSLLVKWRVFHILAVVIPAIFMPALALIFL